ncbi:MAG: class I SAM-dependent methyltransferase [Chloroflexota bacterium]
MKPQKDPENFEREKLLDFATFDGARVLEIGCGEGRLTWKYASASRVTIGLDPDPDALRVARADRPAGLRERVHFTRASAYHLPLPSQTFDIAILAWSL